MTLLATTVVIALLLHKLQDKMAIVQVEAVIVGDATNGNVDLCSLSHMLAFFHLVAVWWLHCVMMCQWRDWSFRTRLHKQQQSWPSWWTSAASFSFTGPLLTWKISKSGSWQKRSELAVTEALIPINSFCCLLCAQEEVVLLALRLHLVDLAPAAIIEAAMEDIMIVLAHPNNFTDHFILQAMRLILFLQSDITHAQSIREELRHIHCPYEPALIGLVSQQMDLL